MTKSRRVLDLTSHSEPPLRTAEEERLRGDYLAVAASLYETARIMEPKIRGRMAAEARTRALRSAVDDLKAKGRYENPNAAATLLIHETPEDADGKVWGYLIDENDPRSRDNAIHLLAKRIRRLQKK